MKTRNFTLAIFLLCNVLFTTSVVQAQSLWASAFSGGPTNGGTIMKMNADGSSLTTVYDFSEFTGSSPMGSLLQASNGKVYGTCVNGGTDSSCVIFCYDPDSNTYTNCWSFDITHGDFPMSGLVQASNGMLYGAASAGGLAGYGVIYSFNTITNVYTEIYAFVNNLSYSPYGSPIIGTDGKLYGMTSASSGQTLGGIYSYDINGSVYNEVYSFTGTNDGYAYGSLIEHNGLMYGMSSGMSQYAPVELQALFGYVQAALPPVNYGSVFSFDPITRAYTRLYNFDSVSGGNPYGSLLLASDGKLYGMTSAGGANNLGVIFSLDPGSNTYHKLYDFDGTHGANPMSDLMQSSDGKLYGATSAGGSSSMGVAFRFDPVSKDYNVIAELDNTTGGGPLGGSFAVVKPSGATGILTPKNNLSLSAYPVPAHNYITVNLESSSLESTAFTLSDMNGRVVEGFKPVSANGSNEIKLDLSFLDAGVYFLRATTGDNVVTKKIVRE